MRAEAETAAATVTVPGAATVTSIAAAAAVTVGFRSAAFRLSCLKAPKS